VSMSLAMVFCEWPRDSFRLARVRVQARARARVGVRVRVRVPRESFRLEPRAEEAL